MRRPLRKEYHPSGSPPPQLWFDFAQKEFNWTLFPEWLSAIHFSLMIGARMQGCHYLHYMGEDTEVKEVNNLLQVTGPGS